MTRVVVDILRAVVDGMELDLAQPSSIKPDPSGYGATISFSTWWRLEQWVGAGSFTMLWGPDITIVDGALSIPATMHCGATNWSVLVELAEWPAGLLEGATP